MRPAGAVLARLERLGVAEPLADVRGGAHRARDQDRVAGPGAHGALAVDDARPTPKCGLPGRVVVVDVHHPLEPADRRVRRERGLDDVEHPRAVHLREPERELHRRPVAGEVVRADRQVRQLVVRAAAECQRPVLARAPACGTRRRSCLPRLREPEWSITKTRPSSSALDLQEVVATAQRPQLVERRGRTRPPAPIAARASPISASGGVAVDRCAAGWMPGRHPRGDLRAGPASSFARSRGVSTVRSVSTRATPQPMSTPMAYGTTALSANSTPPIGMP